MDGAPTGDARPQQSNICSGVTVPLFLGQSAHHPRKDREAGRVRCSDHRVGNHEHVRAGQADQRPGIKSLAGCGNEQVDQPIVMTNESHVVIMRARGSAVSRRSAMCGLQHA